MIEVEEIKTEKEKPTETDVRLLFGEMRKPMEALQSVFLAALKELDENGVETKGASLSITDDEINVRLGGYLMWLSVHICGG